MIKKYLTLILFVVIFFTSKAQVKERGVPYIRNFLHTEYKSNSQNFAIVQDNRGIMYFANQTVILEYDGKNWRQIFLPGNPTIYSLVKDKNGRIYVGASNEFGYLSTDSNGSIVYVSLVSKIPKEYRTFTRVRNIIILENEVIFVTPVAIYIYNNNTIKVKEVKDKNLHRFVSPFQVFNDLYLQIKDYGLVKYGKPDTLNLIPETAKFFAENWVTGMFPYNKEIALITWNKGIYTLKNKIVEPLRVDSLLNEMYCYSPYTDNYYSFGMYSGGFIFTDKFLNPVKKITAQNGLQSNQVFSVYTDTEKNVWLGLANGISVIYANSPYSVYNENYGLTGTTYTSMLYNDKLYVGSSTGVYYKNWNSDKFNDDIFKPIANRIGAFQIWQIDTINNHLLCAGSSGFFYVNEKNEAVFLKENTSTKTFIKLKKHPGIILAAGGNGFAAYEYKNNTWKFKFELNGFKRDVRHIEEDTDGTIWVSDRNEGIYRLVLSPTLEKIDKEILYNEKHGLPSKYDNYVFKLSNRIVFATEKGIYRFDKSKNKFVKDEKFDKYFDYNVKINLLYRANNGKIWFKEEISDPKNKNKKHWELGNITENADSVTIERIPFLKVKDNIFSVNSLSEKDLLIGNEKGFVLFDLKYKKNYDVSYRTAIRSIEIIKNDSLIYDGAFADSSGIPVFKQNSNQVPQLSYEHNALRFNFSAIFYEEPERTQFKFMLEGDENTWSDWKYETTKEYSNLQPGLYTFKVKAKNLYGIESKIAEYKFEILPPWYRTVWAFVSYLVLFGFFIWSIVQLSIRRVKLQKENLERIVKERTAEIEKQKAEIETHRDSLAAKNEEIDRKNKDITSSITYAKRIQEAMLPLKEKIDAALPDYFILYKPRDIVSGDFYWFAEKQNKIIFTAVDCTGHGVPGAFMSMIGSEILTTLVNQNVTDAGEILEKMNKYVVTALKQDTTSNQDGMDMALCVIDRQNKTVEFSGAKNPLVYIQNNELTYIKGDRQAIGGAQKSDGKYEKHIISYQTPTWFYIFSDGYQDQFGGSAGRKFMIKNLKDLLFEIHQKSAAEQHKILDDTIEDWMKNTTQTDDIIVIGFKL